jgi:hypothetical protein
VRREVGKQLYNELFKAGGATERSGVYMAIRDGHKIYLDDPKPEDFQPRRTAFALAHEHRYGGNYGAYSVAQHAVLVAETVARLHGTPQEVFAGLHHDDSEIVTGDVPQPVKAVCPQLKELEARLDACINRRYGINVNNEYVKEADRIVFCAEVRVIVPEDAQHLYGEFGDPNYGAAYQPSWTDLELWPADRAMKRYLEMHYDLAARL